MKHQFNTTTTNKHRKTKHEDGFADQGNVMYKKNNDGLLLFTFYETTKV